jgi:hypothetical protein
MGDPISIKFDNGEFYEKLWNRFDFHLDRAILTTTSHKSVDAFLSLLSQILVKKFEYTDFLAYFDEH